MRQSILILAAAAAGLALGALEWVSNRAGQFVLPCLVLMLVGVFLSLPANQIASAFGRRRVIGLSLAVNFIWNPILAWLLGWLFLREQPALRLGLILLKMGTPCTDWYLVFTSVARGNVALGTAMLPWNLILQLVLLPVFVWLFAGTLVPLEWRALASAVVVALLLPLFAAAVLRRLLVGLKGRAWFEQRLLPASQRGQQVFLGLAIAAMFASESAALFASPAVLVALLPPVLLFFALNFALAYALGRAARLPYPDYAALSFTTLARNSPIALGVALVAFPAQPLIALALVIGPLIELPVLSLVAQFLLRLRPGWREPVAPNQPGAPAA